MIGFLLLWRANRTQIKVIIEISRNNNKNIRLKFYSWEWVTFDMRVIQSWSMKFSMLFFYFSSRVMFRHVPIKMRFQIHTNMINPWLIRWFLNSQQMWQNISISLSFFLICPELCSGDFCIFCDLNINTFLHF